MSSLLRRLFVPLFCAALAGLWAPSAGAQAVEPQASHPFGPSSPIPGRYIVRFKPGVADPAAEAANLMGALGAGGQIHHVYTAAIKGFAATLPDSALAGLRNHPLVDVVEQDQTVSLSVELIQDQATWGLDRIDQLDRPLDTRYHYAELAGSGVTAFIIDTGIRADHLDFGVGRVLPGFTSIADGRDTADCNGHGTHVSGTVGGSTWGVAKRVALVPVRVLDCRGSGTWSGVIAGLDFVAGSTRRPAVANMSLGGGKSSSLNAAVAGTVGAGVTVVVAAGNSSADACNYSPASEPSAVTVAATTSNDARASYSNYGTCVDIFAPGSSITSAWYTSTSATNTISGTSMASPHVTGAAALVAAANPGASPAAIASFLVGKATPNRVGSAGSGSPNLLLYSLASGAVTEPVQQPVAVNSISTTADILRNGWRAHATVTVGDPAKQYAAVANVTVNGSFSPGGSVSCVTSSSGSCTLTSGRYNSSTASTVFSMTGLAGTNIDYQPGMNLSTQLLISKP